MTRNVYGPPRVMSRSDWALFTNEQYGFTGALVSGVNNVFAFAMPYPSGFNLETQTITSSKFEFDQHDSNPSGDAQQQLSVMISMLDKELSATFNKLTDADDENLRAQFASAIMFGDGRLVSSFADANGNVVDITGEHRGADWYPEIRKVDQLTPMYFQFINNSMGAVTAAGGGLTNTNYLVASVEATTIREWFNVRALTGAEKSMRNQQLQWLRLNS